MQRQVWDRPRQSAKAVPAQCRLPFDSGGEVHRYSTPPPLFGGGFVDAVAASNFCLACEVTSENSPGNDGQPLIEVVTMKFGLRAC